MFVAVFLVLLQFIPSETLVHPVVNAEQDEIMKELIANMSLLRQDVEASALREEELNRRISNQEMREKELNKTISLQQKEISQTIAILNKTFTEREDELNKTISLQQKEINKTKESLKLREEEVNRTIQYQLQKFKNREQKLNQTIEKQQQMLATNRIELDRMNQSLSAHEIILHDDVSRFNTQEHNNDIRQANLSGQIRYLALSLHDVRKQFNNFSVSERELAKKTESKLKDLSNQMVGLNTSLQGEKGKVAFTVARSQSGSLHNQKVIYDKAMRVTPTAHRLEFSPVHIAMCTCLPGLPCPSLRIKTVTPSYTVMVFSC